VSNTADITHLYEKHAGELLAYFARRCPAADANDLLHETFLQVIRHPRLTSVTLPRAWLFGIARHILSRHYREETTRLLAAGPAAENAEPGGTREAIAPAADPRLGMLRDAIEKLSPELRETLQLRLEQDLSYEEIAAVLEIPIGTVRSRLHMALRRLQEALHPNHSQSSL
jgi:RNA polymerase sigma-70 factor (ECF subfamily)